MGLLSRILMLPVRGPTDGVMWVAGKLAEHAEAERNSPVALRAALADAERQLLAGEIDEAVYDDIEDDILERLSHKGDSA
ncbi:MAG: gas vesicle protein GvpG [Pseudomonadota bacterium]